MERLFSFPVDLQPQDGGTFLVTFPDVPEAITDGSTEAEALANAVDCLEEALASKMLRGEALPAPRGGAQGRCVSPGLRILLKAALYSAMGERGLSKVVLARLLSCDEKQVRRLLDPALSSHLDLLGRALAACGVEVSAARAHDCGLASKPLRCRAA